MPNCYDYFPSHFGGRPLLGDNVAVGHFDAFRPAVCRLFSSAVTTVSPGRRVSLPRRAGHAHDRRRGNRIGGRERSATDAGAATTGTLAGRAHTPRGTSHRWDNPARTTATPSSQQEEADHPPSATNPSRYSPDAWYSPYPTRWSAASGTSTVPPYTLPTQGRQRSRVPPDRLRGSVHGSPARDEK